MYYEILLIHSWTRWLVLFGLIYILIISQKNRRREISLKNQHLFALLSFPIVCLIQLILGLFLYSESPFVKLFFQNYPDSLQQREIRFFGIEHSTIMPIAIGLIIIGSLKTIKNRAQTMVYNIWFKWMMFATVLIVFSIPWSFWPLVSRPLFRLF